MVKWFVKQACTIVCVVAIFFSGFLFEKIVKNGIIESGRIAYTNTEEQGSQDAPDLTADVIDKDTPNIPTAFTEAEVCLVVRFSSPQTREQVNKQVETLSRFVGTATIIDSVYASRIYGGKERFDIGYKTYKEQKRNDSDPGKTGGGSTN